MMKIISGPSGSELSTALIKGGTAIQCPSDAVFLCRNFPTSGGELVAYVQVFKLKATRVISLNMIVELPARRKFVGLWFNFNKKGTI